MEIYLNTKDNYVWVVHDGKEPIKVSGNGRVAIFDILIRYFKGHTMGPVKKRGDVIDYSAFKRKAS